MSDYSALAQRVSAGIDGVRGCLLLSRDGMVLGAHPEGDVESNLRSAWVRFAAIGDPERSYVEFPDRIWAFVRRGGYAVFAVADVDVRPGLLIDQLDQVLIAGEQDRVRDRDTMRLPEAPTAPSGKPRTSLHKDRTAKSEPVPVTLEAERADAAETDGGTDGPPDAEPASGADPGAEGGVDEEAREDHGSEAPADPDRTAEDAPEPDREHAADDAEVDRILLAKEFAGLLQVSKEDDEATR